MGCTNELLKLLVAIYQHLFVGDRAWDFQREYKAGRRLKCPFVCRLHRRAAIKPRIHLNRVRTVIEIIRGFNALRIDVTTPAIGSKRRCSEADLSAQGQMLLCRNGQAKYPSGREGRA